MRATLLISGAAAGLTLAGLAFTAAVCLLTVGLVAVGYALFGPWSAPGSSSGE